MPNNLIHTSLIWLLWLVPSEKSHTFSSHYPLYQQMSSRRWFSAQRKIDCTPASIRCLYNPMEYCKIHNTDSFVGLRIDIPFANISISGDGKRRMDFKKCNDLNTIWAKILKLRCCCDQCFWNRAGQARLCKVSLPPFLSQLFVSILSLYISYPQWKCFN